MKKRIFEITEIIFYWMLIAFMVISIVMLIIHISNPEMLYGDVYVKERYRYNISAIEDNIDVKGKLYYRSGYIEQKLYYYLVKEGNGYKTVVKIPADKTRIIETNEEQPKVIYYAEYFSRTNRLAEDLCFNFGKAYFELYVPADTITTDWNVDLE